jgi:hypothetical protein
MLMSFGLRSNLPVDNSLAMEILQSQQHLTGVEFRLSQGELLLLDVQHEISSTDVLHDKVDPCLGLEARMKSQQERVTFLSRSHEDPLL